MADHELTTSSDEPEADQPDRDWQAEATKWKALARKQTLPRNRSHRTALELRDHLAEDDLHRREP